MPDVTAWQLAGVWQGATACLRGLHEAMQRAHSTPDETTLSCGARAMIAAMLQHPDATVVETALHAMSLAVRVWPTEALGFLPCVLYRVRASRVMTPYLSSEIATQLRSQLANMARPPQ